MTEHNKATGKFLVKNVEGVNYVLKHEDSNLMAVVEASTKFLSEEDNSDGVIENVDEGDRIEATLVSTENMSDTVWMFEDLKLI